MYLVLLVNLFVSFVIMEIYNTTFHNSDFNQNGQEVHKVGVPLRKKLELKKL